MKRSVLRSSSLAELLSVAYLTSRSAVSNGTYVPKPLIRSHGATLVIDEPKAHVLEDGVGLQVVRSSMDSDIGEEVMRHRVDHLAV